jgi:hypothetical protein
VWVVGGGLVSIWLFGILHAYEVHDRSAAILAAVIPPYGLYMTLEASFAEHPELTSPGAGDPSIVRSTLDLRNRCLSDSKSREMLKFSEPQYEVFCLCISDFVGEIYTDSETEYVNVHGENSPEFRKKSQDSIQNCLASARYLGGQ